MQSITYQSHGATVWEVSDRVAEEMVSEGIIQILIAKPGFYEPTESFQRDWGHKTHEAICLAVAIFQADDEAREPSPEIKNVRDNLTDAVVILKGGTV